MSNRTIATVTHIGRDVPDEVAFPLLRARLMSKCRVTESGCWEWTGYCHDNGYGETAFRGRGRPIHRLMWMIERGPVPKGMDVMHKCDNAPCFNPDHLELGTRKQNLDDCVARGRHFFAKKTHCKRGHELSGENLYVCPEGRRHCKSCTRAKQRMRLGWPEELARSAPACQGHYPDELTRLNPPKGTGRTRTHCPRGHEMVGDNVYMSKDGYKKCRPCRSASAMRFRPKKPEGYELNTRGEPGA